VFSPEAKPAGSAAVPVRQIYPKPGWVEHDPDELFDGAVSAARGAVAAAGLTFDEIAAIGVANQRETVVVWERATGRPVANAIVWQCRRTAEACETLRAQGHGEDIQRRTGLVIDPYFSATKIAWLLDRTAGGRRRGNAGELCAGTVDSWLLFRLTGGRRHATDATNASRTMLLNIHDLSWDETLLRLLDIPLRLLPEVRPSAAEFGETDPSVFGRAVPVMGIAGDQSAALYGQACFAAGMAKCTFGTGAFILANAGFAAREPLPGLITTVAWRTGRRAVYALEGSVFTTGAAVQWLRDELGIIATAADSDALAQSLPDNGGVYFVPAFAGLGAPHWDSDARGAIVGLTGGAHRAYLARAALEATAYQVRDVVNAMAPALRQSRGERPLRADGGQSASEFLMQFQADILDRPVEVAAVPETTALGAGGLAGRTAGLWGAEAELASLWEASRVYEPRMSSGERLDLCAGWDRAVAQARHRPPTTAALL
jgi:glycerol kinase